jgi:chromosome partitioning protein
MSRAKIIALANQKGGVTKTTSTYNIATVMVDVFHKRVLIVDLDPQASLTLITGREPEHFKKNICNVLKEEISAAECRVPILPGMELIPSIIDLASTELQLNARTAREQVLKKALKPLTEQYDFIFIDCPPQLTVLTLNALTAADGVLIPCQTDYLAYRGLTALEDTIADVKDMLNEKIKTYGVIATLFDSRVSDNKVILEEMKEKYNVVGVIKKTAKANKGIYDGLPVVTTEPNSEIAKEYVKIAQYLLEV